MTKEELEKENKLIDIYMSKEEMEKIPFITLDNISNYFNNDDESENDSVDNLIVKAYQEYKLALKNPKLEKRIMLLNNVCIYFNKIKKLNGQIPTDLFFNTKGNLLDIYISLDEHDKVNELHDEIKNFYDSLNINTKEEFNTIYTSILFNYAKYFNDINEFDIFIVTIEKIFNILKNDESDEALFIKSKCHSLLSALNFEAKRFDNAIDYAYTALVLVNKIENKTQTVIEQYATYAFNLGNIYFQCDKYENAITLFNLVIDFSKEHSFDSKLTIFTYSSNYLAQVYVCQNKYQDAIDVYLSALSFLEDNYSNNDILDTRFDFLNRISIIYDRFLNDQKNSLKYSIMAKNIKE